MRKSIIFLFLTMLSFALFSSGISIPEQGSKASAMGNAFVATADDPSALYYNPAGIAFLDGKNFTFNLTYINPHIKYSSPTLGEYKDRAKNFFIPSLFFTMPFNDKIFFGFSFGAPYDLSTDWSDTFPGRFISRHAKIVTFNYHPVLAFKLNEKNSLSIGLDYYDSSIALVRVIDTTAFSSYVQDLTYNAPYTILSSYGTIDTRVRDQAFGFDIGYLYKGKPWSFGLTYKSKASFDYEGHSSFERSPYLIGNNIGIFPFNDTKFKLDSVPATAQMGLSYEKGNLLTEFDIQWTNWSQWDKTKVHFSKHTIGTIYVWANAPLAFSAVPVIKDEKMVFYWKDTYAYRLGFNYKYSDKTEIRWGIVYDEAPIPDKTLSPVLPDKDRWMLTFGMGHKVKGFVLDWYTQYIKFKNGDIKPQNIYRYTSNGLYTYPLTPDGKYKGYSYLCGVQISYKF